MSRSLLFSVSSSSSMFTFRGYAHVDHLRETGFVGEEGLDLFCTIDLLITTFQDVFALILLAKQKISKLIKRYERVLRG